MRWKIGARGSQGRSQRREKPKPWEQTSQESVKKDGPTQVQINGTRNPDDTLSVNALKTPYGSFATPEEGISDFRGPYSARWPRRFAAGSAKGCEGTEPHRSRDGVYGLGDGLGGLGSRGLGVSVT